MIWRIRVLAGAATCLFLAAGSLVAHDPHDPIQVVAISPNFAQDHTVLAATSQLTIKLGVVLLLKSTDGGVNWTAAASLPNNTAILSVAFSPNYGQDQTVFAAGSGGLFVSTDGANSWTSLSSSSLVSLALSPNFASDNTLFVVTKQNTIYRSTNRGGQLTLISSPSSLTSPLTTIAVSPVFATDHTLLVGTGANGIFKTANGGGSWFTVTSGQTLPEITALSISPAFSSDHTAFAGTLGSGVLVSTNNGKSWKQSNTGLTDGKVSALALSPTFAQDSTLWAATAVRGVFQSTNRAASWLPPVTVSRALSTLTSVHYQTIAVSSGIQLLGMFEGLWTSGDNGASWQYIDTCPTRTVRYINMSPTYPQDHTVFLSTYGSGNLWTTDGGVTWTLQNTGMLAPYIDGSAISPNFAADGTAFSGNHFGLQWTNDYGATWSLLAGPGVAAYPRGLAVSPNFAQDHIVFIGTTAATGHNTSMSVPEAKITPGLYISTNGGQNWTLSTLSGQGIVSIAFSPAFATDRTAFAATQHAGVYETTDSGATWTALSMPGPPSGIGVVAVSPNFANDRVVLAGAIHGGIYKTSNGGATWQRLSGAANIRALDIKFSPNYATDQTFFAGTIQQGLMESTDGGTILSPVTSFPDVVVTAVGISSGFQSDHTIFAAGYHGVYKSTDGGTTWAYLATPARIEESRNVASALQEPPTITYQGTGWSMFTPTSLASTNQYATTPELQDTATLEFLGTGVEWVSLTGPLQGSATISLDGVYQTTVSLTGGTSYQKVVWRRQGLPCGNHTLTVTATPLVAQSIAVDAFDIWVDECPYTAGTNVLKQSAVR